jgi:hypothetical protein
MAKDPLGPQSPYLDRILNTHWIRTALISASALIQFIWVLRIILGTSSSHFLERCYCSWNVGRICTVGVIYQRYGTKRYGTLLR